MIAFCAGLVTGLVSGFFLALAARDDTDGGHPL